jgi:predicted RNA binding protein YcfA (HicA-like mRNA interferase family)
LPAKGWLLKRIRGSHHIYSIPGERKAISVPVNGKKDLKTGLALRIAPDAGVDI